jgi:hypothetical protein
MEEKDFVFRFGVNGGTYHINGRQKIGILGKSANGV